MPQLIRRINSQNRIAKPVRKFDIVDALGLFTVIACTCLGVFLPPLQVAHYRWERAARADFDARMPAPVVLKPLFDFVGHERFINGVAAGLFSLGVEFTLIAWSRPIGRLIDRRFVGRDVIHAEVARGPRAIRRIAPPKAPPSPPVTEDGVGPEHLRARAETCFRLAQGAVSPHLAEELESLGREFEREAEELEK